MNVIVIGLGNIAGVAIAVTLGGPGAVFWMWIMGVLGMATKFVECTLGTHFRSTDPDTQEVRGGPMSYIVHGMGEKWRPMAKFYACCAIFGAFGAGCMFQANQSAMALYENFMIPHALTGFILSGLVALVIIGGIQRIGQVASRIVPFMCCIYVVTALIICIMKLLIYSLVIILINSLKVVSCSLDNLYFFKAFFATEGVLSSSVAFLAPLEKFILSSLIGHAAANPPALWNESSAINLECPVPKMKSCPPFLYELAIIFAHL